MPRYPLPHLCGCPCYRCATPRALARAARGAYYLCAALAVCSGAWVVALHLLAR